MKTSRTQGCLSPEIGLFAFYQLSAGRFVAADLVVRSKIRGLGVRGGLGGQTGVSAQRGFSGAGAGGGHTGLRGNGGAEGHLRASLERQ